MSLRPLTAEGFLIMEIWKSISGYDGNYQVSNLGRVKSFWFGKERILKSSKDGRGYLSVHLYKDGIRKPFRVHQLVAVYFLNHNPCGHVLIVDHVDNNKLNNNLNNIQVISHRENISKNPPRDKIKSSKYIGVYFHKRAKKFRSCIKINGKQTHLGYFKNELKAAEAYQTALKELL